MYHGNADELALHKGLCLAGENAAADYARYASSVSGRVHRIEFDLAGLVVVELGGGHDWDSDEAPGDNAEEYRDGAGNIADVITFADGTAFGRAHETWRLMTDKALAGVTVVGCEMLED